MVIGKDSFELGPGLGKLDFWFQSAAFAKE